MPRRESTHTPIHAFPSRPPPRRRNPVPVFVPPLPVDRSGE
ncbi:hypothetical protein [Chitinophaga caseinilytica]